VVINPLIGCPSPRNIPAVNEARDTIPDDKFIVKYVHAPQAYTLIREFFLKHEDYTHLVICPDDLVVNGLHIEKLCYDLELYNYPVLSGICPITRDSDLWNACIDLLPDPVRTKRKWEFMTDQMRMIRTGVIQVKWMGMSAAFMRRDVVEKIPFQSDAKVNNRPLGARGFNFDVMFCNDCYNANIPIHVDTSVIIEHLKLPIPSEEPIPMVEIMPSKIIFDKYEGQISEWEIVRNER